jgi:hypothetical protein
VKASVLSSFLVGRVQQPEAALGMVLASSARAGS